jgi:spore maturation protein CgeB
MKIVLFYHSLVSDWNHGNAHFLRGVATELIARGHEVGIYEPADSWSRYNLVAEHGEAPIAEFHQRYPQLRSTRYTLGGLDLDAVLADAQLVIVHEWNEHELVRRIGEHRARTRNFRLLFHDTHHRAITSPTQMQGYDLSSYDGVLAYGEVLRELYVQQDWIRRAWTWHEAADTRVFHPLEAEECEGDLVWIGNWGDEERSAELHEFLIEPVQVLGLKAKIYGVRYPETAREQLWNAGIDYGGWLPNYRAPEVFARYKFTVHVPRRPYVEALRGIPTIRPFEALACGIPLICSPWEDAEHLFTPGKDYLVARDGTEMKKHMRALLEDKQMARELSEHGLRTIQERHTCAHRVDELMNICEDMEA